MKLSKKLGVVLMAMSLAFGGVATSTVVVNQPVVAYADSIQDIYDQLVEIDGGDGEEISDGYAKDLVNKLNSMGSDTRDKKHVSLVKLGENKKYLNRSEVSELTDYAESLLDEAREAGAQAKASTKGAKTKVKNMMSEFEVTADTSQAATALAGVQDLVGVVVGILAYLVVIGMALFTGCDICYITMPVFRNWADAKGESGGAVTSATNKDTGEAKFRFVTDEAMYAVQSCAVETGKNALGVYFKKRCIGWILTAIVLYVLLTGQITLLTDVVLQFISGVIAALQGLGE